MNEQTIRITADEFDERHRCDVLIDGCRCLDGKGHKGEHGPSRWPWRGEVVDGKAMGDGAPIS